MYERGVGRTLGGAKIFAGVSLLVDILSSCLGCSLSDGFIFVLHLIYPVIDGNGPFCVLLYLIGQFQAWHLSLPQYVVQGRRTDVEFFCYTALFLVVTLHPFSKLVHLILIFYLFFWTKIRYSDTFVIISSHQVVDKSKFGVWKERVLTYIAQYATM